MTYIHDFSGREISQDTYNSLPDYERRHYHAKREGSNRFTEDGIDLIDVGLEAVRLGIVLGDFADDSHPSNSLGSDSSSSSSSDGFSDGGFGGGDYSGGGSGSDF